MSWRRTGENEAVAVLIKTGRGLIAVCQAEFGPKRMRTAYRDPIRQCSDSAYLRGCAVLARVTSVVPCKHMSVPDKITPPVVTPPCGQSTDLIPPSCSEVRPRTPSQGLPLQIAAARPARPAGIATSVIERRRRAKLTPEVAPLDRRRLRRITDYIDANLEEAITLATLARLVTLSPFYFAKRFRAATGISPYAYVVAQRMARAMQLLKEGRSTVAQAAQAVGYSQVSHFRRQFTAHWRQSPGRLST